MDNNPLSTLNTARTGLNNTALDVMKNELMVKHQPKTTSSLPSTSAPAIDFIGESQKANLGKIDLSPRDVDQRDVFKQIGNEMVAKYDTYIPNIDNNEFYAQQQSKGQKWSHGLQKLGLKTGTAVLGGTVGSITGLLNSMAEGSLTAMYTDDFNQMLDDYNEKLDYKLPNFYTEQERDLGFFDSMGTANFWANDFTGGLSFTLGMIVSEGIWAAATGGTSLLARGGTKLGELGRWSTKALGANKALEGLNKYKEPVKKLINSAAKKDLAALRTSTVKGAGAAKLMNQGRFIYTSAGYEAGVEARHYLKEMEDEWMMNFQEENGRNPSQQELSEFLQETGNTGNAVWGTNVALVGSSNMAVFGKMLLGKSTKQAVSNSAVKRDLFGIGYDVKDGVYTAVKASKPQKIAGRAYGFLKYGVIEGVYEEGGQSVAAKAVKDYVLDSVSPEATQDNFSMIDSFITGIKETYTTKEGQKEVGLGMLIGLFGGAITTGGKFNEISNERKRLERNIEYRNKFQPKDVLAAQITSERLRANNKILKANKRAETARKNKDLTGEFISDQQAILASVERDNTLQGLDQGIEDFEAYLNTVDNAELAKELGLKENEVGDWKAQKLSDYKAISERYKNTERYVRALVGDQNFAGTAELKTNSEDIIKAITYNITLGEQSNEFTKKLVEDIKLVIGGQVSADEATVALDVDQVLSTASREAVSKYMGLSKQVKAYELERANLERQLISEQYNKGKAATPEQHADRLQAIQEKIIAVQDKIESVNQTKTAAYRALGIKNDAITEEDIDAQAERVKALEETIKGYKNTDPELYATLSKLFDEYTKSRINTVSFSNMTQQLLDPKMRVDVLNGWMSSLLKKNKSLDESTKEFFREQLSMYMGNQLRGLEATAEAAQNDTIQADTPEEITSEAGDEMNPPAPKEEVKKDTRTPLQKLKQKIADIMSKNVYTTTYVGNDYDEAIKSKPSESDVNRYEELLGKINSKYITQFSQLLRAPKGWHKRNNIDTGLTVEEIEELKGIQQKLSNWQVLEGTIEQNGETLADLMLLVEQLETQVEKDNTKTEITETEYATIKQASDKEAKSDTNETAEGVQSPDQVLVSKLDIAGEAFYSFFHLDVLTLTRLFPNSTLDVVQGETTKPVSELSTSELAAIAKEEGTKFILNTPDGVIDVTVGKRSRLNISMKSLDNSIKSSNIAFVKYNSGNFMDVYEVLSNGALRPLKGDFTYSSELAGEVLELVPQVVNNVTEGQVLITRINKNDSFNKAAFRKYKKAAKKDPEGALTKLMNDLHIYITDQSGQLIGSLRAANTDLPDTNATKALLELRRKAVDMYLDAGNTESYFSLNESVPVKTVLIGSPNLVIGEDMKPVAIDFTDTALEQVEDVGYLEGETLKLRKMDGAKVIKTFLPKNSAQKMPVVIVKVNGKSVAFPVTLKSTEVDRTTQVNEIDATQLRNTDKISRISAILIESGLKPINYITEVNGEMKINIEKVLADLANVKDFPNLADWLQSSYKIETLKGEAQIAIDLDNQPFHLSKIMLDLSQTKTIGAADAMRYYRSSVEDRLNNLIDSLQEYEIEIDSRKQQYPTLSEDSAWNQALFVNAHLRNPATADNSAKRQNINMMTDAVFTVKVTESAEGMRKTTLSARTIPKSVRNAHGDEFLNNLKKDLTEYNKLKDLQYNTSQGIKNSKVKKEKDNENTKCPS